MGKLLKRWFWRLFFVSVYLLFLYQLWIFCHVLYWNDQNPTTSAFMQNQLSILQEKKPEAKLHHVWVPYTQIAFDMKRAIIAAEDGKFTQHSGFDFDSIHQASKKIIKEKKIVAGGSTISQQLAKNLFLSSKKSVWRKSQEAIITLMLEHIMTKRRILEIYLNIIEWGNGVFGIEAAARHYFGIPAASLSAKQASYLASMVTNPRYYDNNRESPHLQKKSKVIFKRLHSAKIP